MRITDLFPEAAERYDGEPDSSLPLLFVVLCAVGVIVGSIDLIDYYLTNIYNGG